MKGFKRLHKLRCKIQQRKKVIFFDYFGVHVAILFYKTASISANNPIVQRNHSWLKVFNVLINEIIRNLTKIA